MYDSTWDMLTSMLTADHPDWAEQQVRDEVIRRLSHGYTLLGSSRSELLMAGA